MDDTTKIAYFKSVGTPVVNSDDIGEFVETENGVQRKRANQ